MSAYVDENTEFTNNECDECRQKIVLVATDTFTFYCSEGCPLNGTSARVLETPIPFGEER